MRRLFGLVVVLFCSNVSFAQSVAGKWSFMLNAEFSVNSMRKIHSPFVTTPYGPKATTSIFYGVYAEHAISPRLAVTGGFCRNERGGKAKGMAHESSDGFDYYDTFSRKIANQYWSLPLTARYYFPVRQARIYAEAGAYGAIRMSGTVQGTDTETITQGLTSNSYASDFWTTDSKSHTNKYDFGLVGGGGIRWPMTDKVSFQLGLRLVYGLRQVDGMNNNKIVEGPSASNVANIQYQDYYGLSSFSRYVAATATAGLVLKL